MYFAGELRTVYLKPIFGANLIWYRFLNACAFCPNLGNEAEQYPKRRGQQRDTTERLHTTYVGYTKGLLGYFQHERSEQKPESAHLLHVHHVEDSVDARVDERIVGPGEGSDDICLHLRLSHKRTRPRRDHGGACV